MKSGYICIDNNIFPTLLAISEIEQTKGLMGQKWPPPIMSFIYPNKKINKFWMANTPSALDIVFCCEGKISQICFGEPYSTSAIGSNQFSDLVIEFPYGTIKNSDIKMGDTVSLVKPTYEELRILLANKK